VSDSHIVKLQLNIHFIKKLAVLQAYLLITFLTYV